jgi:hypothetical protein
VAACFLGAAQDAFDVDLRAEVDDMRGFGQVLAGLIEGGQRRTGIGVGEGFCSGVPDREPLTLVDELVVRGPPDLVVGGGGDGAEFGAGDGAADGGVEVRAPRFWGSTVPKYCTSQPTQRRVFCQNRSSSAGKWMASRAARR